MVIKGMVYLVVFELGRDYGGVNGFWFLEGYFNEGNGDFWKKSGLMEYVVNVESFNEVYKFYNFFCSESRSI